MVALSLKNSPPVTALMTATVNPNTNLVYYYGGVMVNTVTHEYRMTTNAVNIKMHTFLYSKLLIWFHA